MLRRGPPFVAGLLTGLLSTGLLLILTSSPRGQPVRLLPPPTAGPIRVHVAGAVAEPGVYSLPRGSIVADAVQAAGGPIYGAAMDAVNLAEALDDGVRVYLPKLEQAGTEPAEGISALVPDPATSLRLDLNAATAPELDRLPGIGPALATNIIEYRQLHGPFSEVDDLLQVPGIGPAKLEAIRDLVEVNRP